MDVEEEYLDVLQNIEFAISHEYNENPLIVDFDVENAITALSAHYRAQAENHIPKPQRLNERAQQVYDAVKAMCDLRLGLGEVQPEDVTAEPLSFTPVPFEAIVACLKRIRKSIQTWNKQGGRQGYLTFIQRFIP